MALAACATWRAEPAKWHSPRVPLGRRVAPCDDASQPASGRPRAGRHVARVRARRCRRTRRAARDHRCRQRRGGHVRAARRRGGAVCGRARGARAAAGRARRDLRAERAALRGCVPWRRAGRRDDDDDQRALHGRGGRVPAAHGACALSRDLARPGRAGARGCGGRRSRGGVLDRRRGGDDAVRRAARAARDAGARGRRRSGHAPRGAAVLERDDGVAKGRHADAPQPGREPLPVRAHADDRRGRSHHRGAAVLPHLRPDARAQRRHPPRRDDRDDAALRLRAVPGGNRGAPHHRLLHRAAHRARAGQASARRRARSLEPALRQQRRRAAGRGAAARRGAACRPPPPAGLRPHGGEPGDASPPPGRRERPWHDRHARSRARRLA